MTGALAPLWAISDELAALMDSVATCPEDLLPELQQQIDTFLGMEAAKVDQVAHVLAALDYEQKAAADEIARLQERKKAAAAAKDRLEQYVCRVLSHRGVKALKGNTNTLSMRPSDAVVINDIDKIPEEFKSVALTIPYTLWFRIGDGFAGYGVSHSVSADKPQIKKALKAGETVPGADLEYRENLQRR